MSNVKYNYETMTDANGVIKHRRSLIICSVILFVANEPCLCLSESQKAAKWRSQKTASTNWAQPLSDSGREQRQRSEKYLSETTITARGTGKYYKCYLVVVRNICIK